jgi:hypothetical protein
VIRHSRLVKMQQHISSSATPPMEDIDKTNEDVDKMHAVSVVDEVAVAVAEGDHGETKRLKREESTNSIESKQIETKKKGEPKGKQTTLGSFFMKHTNESSS